MDYYKILGVDKNASQQDIKKAFRNSAKKHHPDKGGDPEEFKKLNNAYETLGNEQKRSQYDQFGAAGVGGNAGGGGFGGGGGFEGFGGGGGGGFEDIFSSFFGGESGGNKRSTKGSDLEIEIEISFAESLNSCSKKIRANRFKECKKCDGKGGDELIKCGQCGGKGAVNQQVRTPFGVISQSVHCPSCKGAGQTIKNPCGQCAGEGRQEESETVEIKIPAGIAHGESLRMTGYGDCGKRKAPAGDLYVHIFVEKSSQWVRQGMDILSIKEVNVFQALSGGEITVETFWGELDFTIPECTPDRKTFRLKNKGVKKGSQTGDHLVTIRYKFPKKLTTEQREFLAQQ
jgi:molecular chaperone DnaJ